MDSTRLVKVIVGIAVLVILTLAISYVLVRTQQVGLFKEGEPVTWLSFALILSLGFISARVFALRSGSFLPRKLHDPVNIWMLLTVGFVLLGFDEIFELHEQFDKLVHTILEIEETAITDRLDDAIVVVYGLVGIALLYWFRREIFRFGQPKRWFVASFFFIFVSTGLDIFTNRSDLTVLIFDDLERVTQRFIFTWLDIEEEVAKITAELLFICGFLQVAKAAHADAVAAAAPEH